MVYKYISYLANMQRRLIDRLAKDREYSGTEGKIIHYLFVNKGETIYQKNIENVFGFRAATATQLIDSLEKRGFLQRVPSRSDRRFKEIVLTEKADIFKDAIFHDMELLETQIIRGIAPEELELWCNVTNKMIENLKEKSE